MRKLAIAACVLTALIGVRARCHRDADHLRIATFNIRYFPESHRQVDGAFAELADLDAQIIAVEEITDLTLFSREVHRRLGDSWRAVFEPFVKPGHLHIGVAFDREAFSLLSTRTHDGTQVDGRHKRVLEVRLRPAGAAADDTSAIVRVLVVHFKSGSDGRPVRARQHAGLRRIVRAAQKSGERVVVLGDFNATEPADRDDLAALARSTGLQWNTRDLACTAFWSRSHDCPRSRLDHVLAWTDGDAEARGACATEGCDATDRCPIYANDVSDHCPVIVDLE